MVVADQTTEPSRLPADRARRSDPPISRAQHTLTLAPALVDRLVASAAAHGCTIEAESLAVLIALCARYCRDDVVTVDLTGDAILACVPALATAPGAERLSRISVDTTKEADLRTLTDRLVAGLRRTDATAIAATLPSGIVLDVGPESKAVAAAELTVRLERGNGRLSLRFVYDDTLFDAATITRFGECFARLLSTAVAEPRRALARIPIVSDHDRELMLYRWNATDVPRDGPQVAHRLIESQVERTPDAIAVEFGDATLTFAELNQHANVLARELVARGAGPGMTVALCFARSFELVVSALAVLKSGAAFLPIDPDLPRDRVRFMLEDTMCPLLLVQHALDGHLRALSAGLQVTIIPVPAPTQRSDAASSANLEDRCTGNDLAYVMYTSGSTGRPKGVAIRHESLVNHALWFAERVEMSAHDRMLQHASLSFDAAMPELFVPLISGATIVCAPPDAHRDLIALPELLQRGRISVLQMVPSSLRIVAARSAFASCTALRYLVSGGEAMDTSLCVQIRQQLPSLRIGNFYGPTEVTVDAASYEVPFAFDASAPLPIGEPIANARCRILDPLRGLVPIGVAGELHVGGRGVAAGYLNLPERTTANFSDDPFLPGARLYHTGDLARYLPDGRIECLGRIDTQVKLRGYRIELAEIAMPLLRHPDIRDATVVLSDDAAAEPQLVAYVIPAEGAVAPSVSELRVLLREQLPSYMIPSAFCFLDAFPLTPSGKLDRRALPSPEPVPLEHAAPFLLTDPIELSLREMWERILGVHPIGPDDDFFALGGHSLKAIRLLAEVEREHGVELRAAALFDAPTIRTLARRMREPNPREASTIIAVQRGSSPIPVFVAPGGGGELFVFDRLARSFGRNQSVYVLDMYVFDEIKLPAPRLTLADVAARMISDMRVVQPTGPYQLIGYSLGGKIVFEIAQQLRAAGEQVALLALLDCNGPEYPVLQPFLTRTAKHVRHAASLGPRATLNYLRRRIANLSRYFVREQEPDLKLYADQEESQLVPAHVIAALEEALTPVLRAWDEYVPGFYPGGVVLLRAEQRTVMIGVIDDDPLLGWGRVIGGGIHLHQIACNHQDVLHPDNAVQLSAILRPYLLSAGVSDGVAEARVNDVMLQRA
jgi:amino acid adenylation domain-containing protein